LASTAWEKSYWSIYRPWWSVDLSAVHGAKIEKLKGRGSCRAGEQILALCRHREERSDFSH
jgi:hypothetical protein